MSRTRHRAALSAVLWLGLLSAFSCGGKPRFEYDFEHDASLDELGWNCRTLGRLSPSHASSGTRSLEISFHPAPSDADESHPGFSLAGFDPDWSAYRALVFDAHNPGGAVLEISVRIDDQRDASANEWFGQLNRLEPGDNRVVIPLQGLSTRSGRPLKLDSVLAVTVYRANPTEKRTVYLDHFRLE